jgi:hypothetical protein
MATEESVGVTVEELPPSELGTKVGYKFNPVYLHYCRQNNRSPWSHANADDVIE